MLPCAAKALRLVGRPAAAGAQEEGCIAQMRRPRLRAGARARRGAAGAAPRGTGDQGAGSARAPPAAEALAALAGKQPAGQALFQFARSSDCQITRSSDAERGARLHHFRLNRLRLLRANAKQLAQLQGARDRARGAADA